MPPTGDHAGWMISGRIDIPGDAAGDETVLNHMKRNTRMRYSLLGAALLALFIAACDSKPKEEQGAMTPAGTDMVAPETPDATDQPNPPIPMRALPAGSRRPLLLSRRRLKQPLTQHAGAAPATDP